LKLLNIKINAEKISRMCKYRSRDKAIKMREEGMLSKQLNLWIENLLEIEKK